MPPKVALIAILSSKLQWRLQIKNPNLLFNSYLIQFNKMLVMNTREKNLILIHHNLFESIKLKSIMNPKKKKHVRVMRGDKNDDKIPSAFNILEPISSAALLITTHQITRNK